VESLADLAILGVQLRYRRSGSRQERLPRMQILSETAVPGIKTLHLGGHLRNLPLLALVGQA